MGSFRTQLEEDIKLIKENWGYIDSNLQKSEYAFNYWILSRLYSVDEELISSQITDYNDKGIDCFVHYEDSKELYIIQNKYYSPETHLSRKEATDFLKSPLSVLCNKGYKRSKELQKIFTKVSRDSEYKIWLHMYVSNRKVKSNEDVLNLFKFFNFNSEDVKAFVGADIFDIDDIETAYYGKRYKDKVKFKYSLKTKNKGTYLKILPDEYDLPGMIESYYVMTPISNIYNMYKAALEKNYSIFEENIREYLGTKGINSGIIKTLKSKQDRKNFFYFNNGITIICESTGKSKNNITREIPLNMPQIVNGCQTMNSIYEVLSGYNDSDIKKEFIDTYVIVKILVYDIKKEAESNGNNERSLYKEIVKFTNTQNAINEKAFASGKEYFYNIQKEFKSRGFLLLVKPSDKNQTLQRYSDAVKFANLKKKSQRFIKVFDLEDNKVSDLQIPLEKLSQVLLAFMYDGHYAFTKKSNVLKKNTEIYEEFSLRIHDKLSIDNMINIYMLYKKAEMVKKNSIDKKTPIPYYVINFLGHEFGNIEEKSDYLIKFNEIFADKNTVDMLFGFWSDLSTSYRDEMGMEYNDLIKSEMNTKCIQKNKKFILKIMKNSELNDIINSVSI